MIRTSPARDPAAMQRLHIFRAGNHGPMQGGTLEFSAADLAASAQAYDPARHEAPIVVGHPKLDAPAYGWVGGLQAEAGNLFAAPRQVEAGFAELVQAGRFKKISASFYTPASPGNPVPGVYYLKHVGFLGAAPPAVKGLRAVAFSDDDDAEIVTVEFSAPDAFPDPPNTEGSRVTDNTAEELARREADLAAREARFAAREAESLRAETAAFADGLVRAGRLPQGLVPRVTAFMDALPPGGEVSFADAGTTVRETPRDSLRALLSALPVAVNFTEATPPGGPGHGDPVGVAEFAGLRVDPDRMALHNRALAYQRAHPGTEYLAAIHAVEQAG